MKQFYMSVAFTKKAWNQRDAILFARLVRAEVETAGEDLIKMVMREKEEYPIMKRENEKPKSQTAAGDGTDPRDGT